MNNSLELIREEMFLNGQMEHARKVDELIKKHEINRLEIALCGHFSAGKSSLLNFLCDKRLLPTSPIPTSANLVRIAFGEPRLEIEMGENHIRSVHPLDINLLDEWCRNGDDIRSVEIYDEIPYLEDGLGLLDTPGIDSTDPAHKQATEAALHLADAVFYVMDYNHVQSELNFSFVKGLQDRNKPIVLIVNQIDKHREEELSFEAFRQGTVDSFASWGVHPLAIVYVSVKVPSHPYSEWDRLKRLFTELRKQAKPCIENNIAMSLEQIIQDYVVEQNKDREQDIAQLELETTRPDAIEAEQQIITIQDQLVQLEQYENTYRQKSKLHLNKILEDANLTPSSVRDSLLSLLESLKPGFKMGFLSSAKKVETEREMRLAAFTTLFEEHVQSNALAHILKWLEGQIEYDQSMQFRSPVVKAWVLEEMGTVQSVSGEFVLNTSKKLADSVRQNFRQQINRVIEDLLDKSKMARSEKMNSLQNELNKYQDYITKKTLLVQLTTKKVNELSNWLARIPFQFKEITVQIPASSLQLGTNNLVNKQDESSLNHVEMEEWQEVGFTKSKGNQGQQLSLMLSDVAKELTAFTWLDTLRESLMERARRMENQRFLFALFGAFSAGKSSFANALLGESVLPVSPNPTTAAINKIVPPSDAHPHETAWIQMKSEQSLFDDVRFALTMLGLEPSDMNDALAMIRNLKEADIVPKAKPHFSFVKAVEKGYLENKDQFGQRWLADLDQFRSYAANEWLSCFVEEIEFAYACPLTEAGVMLVDTPGADSIHARHTGVAFKFIKEADALFFVTYYNHAFSQADREFLQQLGRVKDQFELDKMFFIINAADLASDEEELAEVYNHVQQQLLLNGVRFPRIFPLSSLQALQARESKVYSIYRKSGMVQLEQELVLFVQKELEQLTKNASLNDLQRISMRLQDWLIHAKQDESKQKEEAIRIRTFISTEQEKLSQSTSEAIHTRIEREVNELLFHVKKRIYYRFGDWFIAAFHPSLWANGGKDHYRILNQAWHEVLANLSYALSQELLATTLRIEYTIQETFKKEFTQIVEYFQKQLPGFSPQQFELLKMDTPSVAEEVQVNDVTPNWLGRFFKNAKAFFEGDGRNQLRLQLEPIIEQLLTNVIDQHKQDWIETYRIFVEERNIERLKHISNELSQYEKAILSAQATPAIKTQIEMLKEKVEFIWQNNQ
ncbi:MAG: hypothetical protein RLZZ267_804 [Bacillota bacterium]